MRNRLARTAATLLLAGSVVSLAACSVDSSAPDSGESPSPTSTVDENGNVKPAVVNEPASIVIGPVADIRDGACDPANANEIVAGPQCYVLSDPLTITDVASVNKQGPMEVTTLTLGSEDEQRRYTEMLTANVGKDLVVQMNGKIISSFRTEQAPEGTSTGVTLGPAGSIDQTSLDLLIERSKDS